MTIEADLAFRQAFALCPFADILTQPYAQFLRDQNRKDEAVKVVELALRWLPEETRLKVLLEEIRTNAVSLTPRTNWFLP